MTILTIITALLGLAFALFGYFIFFRKKYSLINGFEDDFSTGRKTEDYAKRVGLIEFIAGLVLLSSAIILSII